LGRATRRGTPVLAMYAIQIPFFVFQPGLLPLSGRHAPHRSDFYCGALNLALDIVLNLVLMRWFGVAGIALATSLWTVSTFFFLWYWTWKLLTSRTALRSSRDEPVLCNQNTKEAFTQPQEISQRFIPC
jgi:putative peptidoglycan lipid II flippase